MNWIDIDKMLYKMIDRHDNIVDVYAEAEKQFKWDRSQSTAAIDPLVKRHNLMVIPVEVVKPAPRRKKAVPKK
jgi:hypothetical protein